MAAGSPEIARILEGARRRSARVAVATAVLRASAQGAACLLGGALGVAFGARPGFARWAVLLGTAAALAMEGWKAWRALRAARDPARVAAQVAGPSGPLRSDLVSAVELGKERDDIAASGRFSVALVDRHVERAAEALAAVDLSRALPSLPARRAGAALGAVALLLLLSLAVRPVAVGLRRILAGDPEPSRISLEPITGDVELTFRYPAYMRREPRTVSGTGGEIRAPRGTEVELKTRADRPVPAAEIDVELMEAPPSPPPSPPAGEREGAAGSADARTGASGSANERAGASPSGSGGASASASGSTGASASPSGEARRRIALAVAGERDLSGRFLVEGGGSYRFRFLSGRGRTLAEGPPIPIVIEPDAFPEVRITSPQQELEVQPDAAVGVEWQAQDDVGLGELALVVKAPGAEETRRPLRRFEGARRDAGAFELDLKPLGLGEGERLLYWLEVTDGDAVSGPKRAASATHAVKIYSEAEHRRRLMEEVKAAWEELVGVLGDHLELGARGKLETAQLLPLAEALDGRAKRSHERLREVARNIRKDKAGPREIARGIENAAGSIRVAEQRLTSTRQTLARIVRGGKAPEPGLVSMTRAFDRMLDGELEKAVLYIETLLDRQRAEDLVRMGRDLAESRRQLADLLDKYRRAPSDAARKELLARIGRMREKMNDLLRRMAEQVKGLSDEHMNRDALAEMARSKDVAGGLDEVEKALARGDVEAAMKALDAMGAAMEKMLAGLERTAGMPSEKNQELMRELRAFKGDLDALRADQERLGKETEELRKAWRERVAERLREAEQSLGRLERLAKEAAEAARAAEPGAPRRAQAELEAAREGLENLRRALGARDLQAALDAAREALGPAARTAMILEEEAQIAERYAGAGRTDPEKARAAQRQARAAVQKADEVRRELERLLPEPGQVLSPGEKGRLGQQGQEQERLDQRASGLQEKLQQLQERAPIFPPSAAGAIGEVRGHMGQASGAMRSGNVQRGRSEQQAALEGLDRFAKGLEQMARGGGGGGTGFPLPFGEEGMGQESGDGGDPSQERVEVPGAEAWRAPAEFRKDLLDAMKQGTPERYEGEVKRYYEELVK